jgi:hypothetical protein
MTKPYKLLRKKMSEKARTKVAYVHVQGNYYYEFFIEMTRTIVITNDVGYASTSSAKRAANRIAKELNLILNWIPNAPNSLNGKSSSL